ncbi:hypothetical protein HPB51_027139 [Rhipicephalus microplus]|uniref:ACB domain-containing protein n=1 Tax=Rhipicephalus microplus TaxID=6941 RepID=A0A9J6D0Q3_RHIMP|nr:hypothetical protein HPB51_027139 [Rhipicephalus microplus]
MDRTLRRKRATALAFGKRKRRPPIPRQSRKRPTSRQSVGDNEVTLDPQPSTSYRNPADNAEVVRRRCVSESSTEGMLIDVITHQRGAARSPNRDRAVEHDGETIDAEMTVPSQETLVVYCYKGGGRFVLIRIYFLKFIRCSDYERSVMSLDERFNKAAEDVKNLKERPSDEELLELYALYKQGSIGDCNISQPGMFDPKGRAKWTFWNKKKGACAARVCEKAN